MAIHIRRREFIATLGGAVVAIAQQAGKIVSIGILALEAWPPIDTFRQSLNDLGYAVVPVLNSDDVAAEILQRVPIRFARRTQNRFCW